MLRAAIYTRVSMDRQGSYRSVGDQEKEARADCASINAEVVAVLCDNDLSASRYARKKRPDFEKAKLMIARQEIDILVTWESSRSNRDLRVYAELRELCAANKVLYRYSGTTYDLNTRDGRFRTAIDAVLNEDESERISERVKRGMRGGAQAGRPHGRLGWGYRRVYDADTKVLLRVEPVPEQARALHDAARRVLAGESLYSIAKKFDVEGIPCTGTSTRWEPVQLRRLLLNPTYVGKRVHQGQVVGEAVWPAILDEATQVRLRSVLTNSNRIVNANFRTVHLLTSIARCGICGGPLVRQLNRGCPSYTCRYRFCVSRKQLWVDAFVTEVVLARLADPRVAERLAAPDQHDGVRAVLDEIAVLRARLDEHVEAAARGELSAATLGKLERMLTGNISLLEAKVRPTVRLPEQVAEATGTDAVRTVWERLDVLGRRAVITAMVEVAVLPAVKGSKRFNPATVRITSR